MAYYLAELYTPKAAWRALSQPQRQDFFAAIGAGMGPLSAMGIEVLALGETQTVMHGAGQQFFAIWRMPDAAAQAALLSGIAATGWHDYFDTVNATGTAVDFSTHLAQLAAA
jgi:hypothetical protein